MMTNSFSIDIEKVRAEMKEKRKQFTDVFHNLTEERLKAYRDNYNTVAKMLITKSENYDVSVFLSPTQQLAYLFYEFLMEEELV